MQIIDGYCNEPNIFADDIGEYNTAIWGTRDCVLPAGERLGYELVSNNEIKIKDGVFSTQGRRGVIKKGTTDSCIIENGTQAENRNDLIVIEYAKDSSTLVESHTLKVIKGTPGEAATDPDVVTGDIQAGDVLHQMPLYRVKLEGLNVVAVERLFSVGNNAIGKEFDPDKDYEIGDLTLQYNKAWKFKVKHLAGAWDESQMEETDVLTELAAQNKNFAELAEKITIPLTPVSQVTGYFAQLYKQGNHIFGNGRIAGMTSLPKVESVSSFDNWTGNLVAAATTGLRRIFSTSGNPFKLENNIYHIIGCGTRSTYNGTTGAIVTNSSVVAAMFDGEYTHILLQYDAIPSASGSTQSGVFLINTMV